jgi:hypothetical protein
LRRRARLIITTAGEYIMSRTVKSARAKTRIQPTKKGPAKRRGGPLDLNAKDFNRFDYADKLVEFFYPFFEAKAANSTMRIKAVNMSGLCKTEWTVNEFQLGSVKCSLAGVDEDDCDWFFCPQVVDPTVCGQQTIYGHANTGTVHPTAYPQEPIAWWETLPGNFEAVWRWEKPIPIAASTARVEAMLHEFGGVLGSHLPDAYLRIPGCPVYSTAIFPWPVVRLRHCKFPIWEDYAGPLFAAT